MPKGLALTIGLNSVDPKSYGGWPGDLRACEADAQVMTSIAKSQGFEVTTLLTKAATRDNVQEKITNAAQILKPGDIFMVSYAGHGGQLPDLNDDEPDALDETWCLYNGEIIDDELYGLFGQFSEGVRILVFSDSCHSGSVTRAAYYRERMDVRTSNIDKDGKQYRFMPGDVVFTTYRLNKEFYDKILRRADLQDTEARVKAPVLLISGCQDNQYSQDGAFNGLFTSQLMTVWKEGAFRGNYKSFHKDIVERMPPDQTPNYYIVGGRNASYEKERPFTI